LFEDLLPELEKSISNFTGSIPVVFKGIERQFAKGDYPQKHNKHVFHELIYVKSGKATFNVEDKNIFVRKGDTLIIRPNKSHQINVEEGRVDMVVLYFDFYTSKSNLVGKKTFTATADNNKIFAPTLENFLQFASGEETKSPNETNSKPFLTIKGKIRQDISSIVERIIRESKDNLYGKELMMQFLAMELLVTLSRGLREEWEDNLQVKVGKAKELVKIAEKFLVENHDRDVSVSDAAAYVFLSQGYFTRAFREETGMSPMNFLMQVRVNHACELLEQKDIKVGGIAREVGFASPQRFNAAFRKYMGITPMEYRKKIFAGG